MFREMDSPTFVITTELQEDHDTNLSQIRFGEFVICR